MRHEPIHRKYHHDELTFSLIYAFHRELHPAVLARRSRPRQRLDAGPDARRRDLWQRFANLRLLYGYQWTHPGKKLLYMGGEFGQWREWNYDESLDWHLLQWDSHGGVQKLVADLNRLVKNEPALHEVDFGYEGFEWVDCHNWELSTLCYMRKARNPDDFLITCCNFTPVPRHNYRIGVPRGGWYYEALNTDSMFYGGSNMGNYPGVSAIECESHGKPYCIEVTLPPLATIVLKPQR